MTPPTNRNLVEDEETRTFRKNYDLNRIAKKIENNEKIAKKKVDLRDALQLQYLLQ